MVKLRKLVQHRETECEGRVIECRFPGCNATFRAWERREHEKHYCEYKKAKARSMKQHAQQAAHVKELRQTRRVEEEEAVVAQKRRERERVEAFYKEVEYRREKRAVIKEQKEQDKKVCVCVCVCVWCVVVPASVCACVCVCGCARECIFRFLCVDSSRRLLATSVRPSAYVCAGTDLLLLLRCGHSRFFVCDVCSQIREREEREARKKAAEKVRRKRNLILGAAKSKLVEEECPQCSMLVVRKNMSKHLKYFCPYSTRTCEICHAKVRKMNWDLHSKGVRPPCFECGRRPDGEPCLYQSKRKIQTVQVSAGQGGRCGWVCRAFMIAPRPITHVHHLVWSADQLLFTCSTIE